MEAEARPQTYTTLERLSVACASPARIAVARRVVTALDGFLSQHYGIDGPSTPEELDSKLHRAAASSAAARKVLNAYENRNAAYALDEATEEIDRRFFDVIAELPFLGGSMPSARHHRARACRGFEPWKSRGRLSTWGATPAITHSGWPRPQESV